MSEWIYERESDSERANGQVINEWMSDSEWVNE